MDDSAAALAHIKSCAGRNHVWVLESLRLKQVGSYHYGFLFPDMRWYETKCSRCERIYEAAVRNGYAHVFVGDERNCRATRAAWERELREKRLAARRVVGDDLNLGVVRPAEVPADDELVAGS